MKKRILSIFLIVCMLMTMQSTFAFASGLSNLGTNKESNPFKDVSQSDWFYDSVQYAIENGIFSGTDEDTFSPNGNMTRAMYVTVMGRIAGINPADYTGKPLFADVDPKAYYAPYVAWAYEKKITAGVGNGQFGPKGTVSREQMAVFTVNYFEAYDIPFDSKEAIKTTPKDLGAVSNWAKDAVLKLWKVGLIKGDDTGNFNPKKDATRAEGAAFTMQTNEVVEVWRDEKNIPEPKDIKVTIDDNDNVVSEDEVSKTYTVTFETNGGSSVAPIAIKNGLAINTLPSPQKTNAIFMGWYTDAGLLGDEFTNVVPIHSNLTLYAKYMEIIGTPETEVDDTYTLFDQGANLSFTLTTDGALTQGEVNSGITLETIDGSEPVALNISGDNGVFTVSASGGFVEGGSYKLTLNDARLKFSSKEAVTRTCDFTIARAESFDVSLNDEIVYIPDEEVSNIIKNGEAVASLSVPVVNMNAGEDNTTAGTFTYSGNDSLANGRVLCIYSGDKPLPGDDSNFVSDDIAYIKVTNVNGTTISYKETESEDVMFLPDVLPIYAGSGNALSGYDVNETPGSFEVDLTNLNFAAYADMGLSADTTVDEGDYIALYTTANLAEANDSDVLYGEVSSVVLNGTTLTVNYTQTTAAAMQSSQGYNSNNDVEGDALLTGLDIAAVEDDIEQQMLESGFANEAAEYFTALATSTESFSVMRLGVSSDNPQKRILLGGSDSGIENLVVKAKINDDTQELSKGVRCAVDVSFEIPIDTGDDNEITIAVTATFVEEIKMSVNASGDEVWKKKWIFKYIDDYEMKAKIDVYNFTGVSFKSTISSKSDTQKIDISEEMQDILASTETDEIQAGVQDLFDQYSEMMSNETDWITLFSKSIAENKMGLLCGVIQIKISVDFVVNVNINVALGSNFEYKNGTRYIFWVQIKDKKADSDKVSLMDEVYNYQFYCLGKLGIRAGISLEMAIGLFSVDLNSVGMTAEAGVYAKMYGYFFYELASVNGKKTSEKSGALYFELGIYLEIAFKAQALKGKFLYNPTLYEKEWPLIDVGSRYNVYNFANKETEQIALKGNSKTFTIPNDTFTMIQLDLKKGDVTNKAYDISDYTIKFSNNNFKLVDDKVTLTVPSGSHIQTGDMTVTWKASALALSSVPIERTFHFVWDDLNANGYTITFNSNGGKNVNSITKLFGASVTAPTAPTKTGYTFGGWYKDVQLTNAYAFTTMGAENLTLYAKWVASTNTGYKVEHYLQDLNNAENYTLQETDAFTGTTGANVTPAVKTYSGFTAPQTQTASILADGSLVVRYYYTRNSYTLTFDANGGNGGSIMSLKYGSAISKPVVTKLGHTFAGWNAIVSETMPASNVTYTATWDKKDYTVVFDSNGGNSVDSKTVTYDSSYGALPTPTRTGFTFEGWYVSETDDNGMGTHVTASDIVSITTSQTLYAKWTSAQASYTVTFDSNGGSSETSIQVTNGSTYGALPTPTRTGFTFEGWYVSETDDNGMGTRILATDIVNLTSAQTLYAKWATAQVTYTVKHYLQNILDESYTLFETQNLTGTAGASVTPSVQTYVGFTSPATQTITILADGSVSVEYQYTRNSYTVTFDANGGDGGTSVAVKFGATLTPPTVTKASFMFNGWSPSVPATMPAADTTYTAQWASSTSVGTLAELNLALADVNVNEITVTSAIPLPNGTVLDGNGKTVKAQTTGLDEAGNVQMGSNYNIFVVSSGSTVTINNLTVKGGSISAITNAGTLTMEDVVITQSGSASNSGGGFSNTIGGVAILNNCSILLNSASYAGGFLNTGTMIMDNCSVTANKSVSQGGGGCQNSGTGTLYLNNTTFSGNQSAEIGGAINNYGATLYVNNSTITGNQISSASPNNGGGIGYNGGTIKVINSLIANNYQNTTISDIGNYSNGAGISIINSYVGAYLSSSVQPTTESSTINPLGNGLTGVFNAYQDVNGVSVPVLVKLANNTFVAPLAASSPALIGGTVVYFDYTISGVSVLAYGATPTYIIGSVVTTPIGVYQGGGIGRGADVIGAYGLQY